MGTTLHETVLIGDLRVASPTIEVIMRSGLLTSDELDALTGLMRETLVDWAWREIMQQWKVVSDSNRESTFSTWLRDKTLHDLVREPGTASELISLAQMIAVDSSNDEPTDFMHQLAKRLQPEAHSALRFETSALGNNKQTLRCKV